MEKRRTPEQQAEVYKYDREYQHNKRYRMGSWREQCLEVYLMGVRDQGLATCIDVGCGWGESQNVASNCGISPANWTGLEVVEYLCQAKRIHHIPGSHDLNDFRDDYADLLLCLDVFEHLAERDIQKTLAEFKRVARKRMHFSISHRASVSNPTVPFHITVKPKKWWADQFKKAGLNARDISSKFDIPEIKKPCSFWDIELETESAE